MFSNAIIDPGTMMVILRDAYFANMTVMLPGFLFPNTSHAKLINTIALCKFFIVPGMRRRFLSF